ncbi:hypothetical protein OESDEN_04964 [Oesophagostomum dentatum]|uniref:Uncharacterized protein n=1 Tax=Oesophagostomum dentatum TaxID=61180 RepID=A0A0B1TI79_OESDE|nr:hypothetical protein OESDEN_04964 [Oesophagostomum dentatum]
MVEVTAQEMFWKQLREHIENYGLTMVVFTISSGLLIGYFLHYIMNVRPLNARLKLDKKEQAEEEEEKESKVSFSE